MDRKDEIKEMLKYLLGKTEKAVDKNQYTDDFDKVLESSIGVLAVAEQIKKYTDELKDIYYST